MNKNNIRNKILKIAEIVEKKIRKEKFICNALLPIYKAGISINYKGYIVYCNETYTNIFGYKKDELIGEEVFKLVVPSEREIWKERIFKGIEGDFETKGIKKDGTEIFIKVVVRNIRIKNYNLRITSVSDITSEKNYIQQIKESEEKYRILTETLLDGVIIIDINGNCLFANNMAVNFFGFNNVEELIGRNILDFFIEKEKFLNELKIIEKNNLGYFTEYEIVDNRGIKLIIETIGRKIIYSGKDAYLISFRDITERKIIVNNLKEAIEKSKKILNQTVIALSDLLIYKDPYTGNHQKRVAKLAVEIARKIGFSGSLIEGIRIASLLHDIGKIFIPADILSKPGELTDIEWEFIRKHPEYGANILKNIEFPWEIGKIVLQHHERLNGTGYPNKLKSKEILLEAKILAVADVVEAMISHRPYREKKNLKEVMEELEVNSGILYESDIVNTTLKILKKGFDFEDC